MAGRFSRSASLIKEIYKTQQNISQSAGTSQN
jgi:hypothetical protein